jgi:ATP-dependent RNA helicase DeaD
MPKEVARIAQNYMENPHEITVGSRNAGAENVSHEVYVVHAKDRYRALRRIVDATPRMYGIIFCRTRMETQQVADHLRRDGYSAEPLHGDLTQMQRDSVMKKFREHHVQMLVATDVAARGLDVNDLTHVINYQLPDDLAAYTHRSGRTGRAGKEGVSVCIIHMREHHKINRLQKSLGKTFTQKPVPTGEEIARLRLLAMAERVRDMNPGPGLIDKHLEELNAMLADLSKEEVIKRFASIDLHRLLLFYRDAPDLNVEPAERQNSSAPRQNDGPRESAREKRENHVPRQMTAGMVELVMNVGKVNGLTPKKLMAMVNVADRDSSVEIGRINIVKMQAYFEVPRPAAQDVINSFEQSHVDCEGRRVSVAMAGNTQSRPNKPRNKRPADGGDSFGKFKDPSRKGGRGQGGKGKRRG